jgi:hypothetical protein
VRKSWKSWAYKAGQLFGAAATTFIALCLITHPDYEPNLAIRLFEIIGSLMAAVVLGMDMLDLNPEED